MGIYSCYQSKTLEADTLLAYLLLCLISSARPLGDNVFLGLGVGCEGECDAGKGSALELDQQLRHVRVRHVNTHKIDADDQLGL